MIDLLTRISELYTIPQWLVNTGAITIFCILVAFPFVVRHLMQPKYYRFRELLVFKVLWRWKYKRGDIVGLWCYCPKCQAMLMVDDENCRSSDSLQNKITYFICNECGGHELSRVVGGDRRYVLSLVKRDIWRYIKEGTYNEIASATKEALKIYQDIESSKETLPKIENETVVVDEDKTLHVKTESEKECQEEECKKDGI